MKKRFAGETRLARRIWPYRVLLLGIIGLLSYAMSYPIAMWLDPQAILVSWLKDFGIACVISMIISLALDRLVHESLLGDIRQTLRIMRKGSDVLEGATELGIENITARRGIESAERWRIKVREAIEKQIYKESGEILIACVAAPEFFRAGSEIGDMLWSRLTDPENKCGLKVLLLSPESKWASLRAKLEPGHPTINDIWNSARYLHLLKKKCRNKIEFHCYDFPPTAFLVITDDLIFVEAYPMVKVETGEGPIGGKVPMLLLRKDTETFRRWKGHFMYIWEEHSEEFEDNLLRQVGSRGHMQENT